MPPITTMPLTTSVLVGTTLVGRRLSTKPPSSVVTLLVTVQSGGTKISMPPQKAKVSITAYDPSVYGSLDGVVVAISPDAVVNERTGESFYTVQVRTTSNALKDRVGRPLPIGTGMIADVSLLGDKRTVLAYIFSPFTKLSESALREN